MAVGDLRRGEYIKHISKGIMRALSDVTPHMS